MPPVLDERGDTVMRHMPPYFVEPTSTCGGIPWTTMTSGWFRFDVRPVQLESTMLCSCFVHVPSASVMDLSPPSVEQDDALSSMDAPSAPTHNMAGFVSEVTPRKM